MSTGNAAAAIGLANSNKILHIGSYVQDAGVTGGTTAGPSASVNYLGTNGRTSYDRNVIDEAAGFIADGNSGAAFGKDAQWVTNTAPLAAGTTRVAVAGGVATADNAAGAYDIFIAVPATGLPANRWFWAFER